MAAEEQSNTAVKFLAAVSGGADSMALLAALYETCAQKERLFCLHVEHGIRPAEESQADAEHVRSFCEKNEINCEIISIPPGKIASFARRKGTGLEAAARFFRRRALSAAAARLGENTKILTAHTKDDLLELVIMRVLRGSGPAGLAAMPQKRGRYLRPMLEISRAEVIEYLKEKNISWREDSTNKDENFLRNRVRRKLIPLLNDSFPSWKTALNSLAQTQSLAADFLANEAQRLIIWEPPDNAPTPPFVLVRDRSWLNSSPPPSPSVSSVVDLPPCPPWLTSVPSVVNSSPSSLSTSEANFFAQPQIIREEAIFQAIDRLLAGKSASLSVRRAVIRRFCAGLKAADLGPVRLRRKKGKILLSRSKNDFSETGFSLLIKEPSLYNLKKISDELSRILPKGADTAVFENEDSLLCFAAVKRGSDD